jgi:hypothetical protein
MWNANWPGSESLFTSPEWNSEETLELALVAGVVERAEVPPIDFETLARGGLHQPPHGANDNDRGGNNVHVNLLDQHTRLRSGTPPESS